MLYGFLKGFALLWPFIKEIFFGKKDLHRYARKNKAVTWLTVCLILVFLFFLAAMQAAFESREEARKTSHAIDMLNIKFTESENGRKEVADQVTDLKNQISALTTKIEEFTKQNNDLRLENRTLALKLQVAEAKIATYEAGERKQQPPPAVQRQRNEAIDALERLRRQEGQQ